MIPNMEENRTIRFLGNNVANVLVSGEQTDGAFCVMELITQPRGGATALHTDPFFETWYVLDGEVEWTVERDGQFVTWQAKPGELIMIPLDLKHRFAGAGETPSRMLGIGLPAFEHFFRALAAAWQGPYDRERTPGAVGPVFEKFGVRFFES